MSGIHGHVASFSQKSRDELSLLSALYGLGTVTGALVGSFSASQSASNLSGYFEDLLSRGELFEQLFLTPSLFLLLALLFGTSFLGLFLIPAAALVRAYLFGRLVAGLYAAYGIQAYVPALLVFGVPMLLFLPAFLHCAMVGVRASGRLYALRFRVAPLNGREASLVKALLFAVISVALLAAYVMLLLPTALRHILY